MKISATLFSYLGRQFLVWLVSVFLIFMAIALLFDVVEMLRRTSDKDAVTLGLVLQMSLLKLPFLSQVTLPFMILFAAMLTFWRLARANEAVVARAAGISAWQFILPAFLITVFVGSLQITVVNPFSAAMLAQFQKLEAEHIKNRTSMISVSKNGLWLRQAGAQGDYAVIHALRVSQKDLILHQVIVFRFDEKNRFVDRIDTDRAILSDGYWLIPNGWLSSPKPETRPVINIRVPHGYDEDQYPREFFRARDNVFLELAGFHRNDRSRRLLRTSASVAFSCVDGVSAPVVVDDPDRRVVHAAHQPAHRHDRGAAGRPIL